MRRGFIISIRAGSTGCRVGPRICASLSVGIDGKPRNPWKKDKPKLTHAVSNPYTTSSNITERGTLSVPTQPWEKTPYGRTCNNRLSSNEGPQILRGPPPHNRTFLIYSAARSDNPDYCLGQLTLKLDRYERGFDETTGLEVQRRIPVDPMDPREWVKEERGCVFYGDRMAGAVGVGHASFVRSGAGEDWIVYHGMRAEGGSGVVGTGWKARSIRAQRFFWDEMTGEPRFPRPGYGPYAVPAGEGA